MVHSKRLGERINALLEMALRNIFWDEISSFNGLLRKDNSVPLNHKNLHALTTEMHEISNMFPRTLNNIFAQMLPL